MTGVLVVLAVLIALAPCAPPRRIRRCRDPAALVALVGAAVRHPMSRRPVGPPDRVVGRALLIAVLVSAVEVRLALPAAFVVWAADVAGRRRRTADREAAIARELPELIDLFALSLAGGGSIHQALTMVSQRPIGPVSARLTAADAAVRSGARLADELDVALDDLGEPVRPLVRALTGAEHYGTSIGPALERMAADAREDRRRQAEARARRVPVRLLGPLVLGVLPAFVLLTVVPTVARTFDGLSVTPGP